MKIIQEFREFAVKGNAIDMAVGVIIGAAFGKIVTSTIDDLIMPSIAGIMGSGVDFSNFFFFLADDAAAPGGIVPSTLAEARRFGPVFAYGNFVTVMINFIILAFCVFMLVKFINKLRAKPQPAPAQPPPPSNQEVLLGEIRDLLKQR
jgi:large conductance mechanosensitive channel